MGLTPKQATFVREYLVDLNATKAAERAGYSAQTAESQASRLLRNVKVASEITKAMDARAQRVEVSAEEVLRELKSIGFADIGKTVAELMQEHGDDTEWKFTPIKAADKLKALELLGKHLKLFTDKTELSGPDGGALQVAININFKRGQK